MSEEKSNRIDQPSVLIVFPSQMKSTYCFITNKVLVVRTRIAPVNSIIGYFYDQVIPKRRILPIINETGTLLFLCVWRLHVELPKNTSSHSQLSSKLQQNIAK